MPLVPLDFHKSGRYCELPNDKSDVEWELAKFVECFGDMVLPVRSDCPSSLVVQRRFDPSKGEFCFIAELLLEVDRMN
jgi:hypothetical protein